MSVSLLGMKIGMTQIFDVNGNAIPVTVLQLGPCQITQIKHFHSDGYNAIQIGYWLTSPKSLTKAQIGHLNKTNSPPLKYLCEYHVKSCEEFNIGQNITVHQLKIGDSIDISGKSIGKGFTGYQKRHHFNRGPMSHGCKNHRQPGSIGAGTTPGRVFPGKKMAGRMGGKQTTIKNLKIIDINTNNNIVIVRGAVPGKSGNLIRIKTK
uniref:Large ribosomal subunit protein uL3c n=1 Tax=Rhodogorgon sp. TaxID=2485824 RepID=A0A3G3MHZ5_9FLOR|nr:ribosomal protein L3 [Rhodogorgon sp.]